MKGWSMTGETGREMHSGEHEKTTLVGDPGELGKGVVKDVSRE
jgi:hypothetical protein